jgi:hypothetical protein
LFLVQVKFLSIFHKVIGYLEFKGYISVHSSAILHCKSARFLGGLFTVAIDLSSPTLALKLSNSNFSEANLTLHSVMWSIFSHWLWFAGARALINSWECALTTVAICMVHSHEQPKFFLGCLCAATCVILRPSSSPFWVVIFVAYGIQHGWKLVILNGFVATCAITSLSLVCDCEWYGTTTTELGWGVDITLPIWAPIQWVKFNYFQSDVASRLFGAHPWHW